MKFMHKLTWYFCCTGKGKGEDLTLKEKFQGAFLQKVCISWRMPSFSTYSHRRDRLSGPWTKCAFQAGYLFSRLCCAVDSNSWINTVRCSIAVSEGVTEAWTSAFGAAEVLQCKWLTAVIQVLEVQLPTNPINTFHGVKWFGCHCFQHVMFSLWSNWQCSLEINSSFEVCCYTECVFIHSIKYVSVKRLWY